jgi:hypothetical protein
MFINKFRYKHYRLRLLWFDYLYTSASLIRFILGEPLLYIYLADNYFYRLRLLKLELDIWLVDLLGSIDEGSVESVLL